MQCELQATFIGLCVQIRPLVDMHPGEEGGSGSFEVLWEAHEWRHSRVLHSKIISGKLPRPGEVVLAVIKLMLGPGISGSKLRELKPWIVHAMRTMHCHRLGYEAPGAGCTMLPGLTVPTILPRTASQDG